MRGACHGEWEVDVKRALICLAMMQAVSLGAHADNLNPGEAAGYIGESNTICGIVSSVTFSAVLVGHPTFLNFGGTYPNQDFTVFVWGGEREQVKPDELVGHRVCVTGSISAFEGRPQMFLQDASQLKRLKD
jgi:hypothetical protein